MSHKFFKVLIVTLLGLSTVTQIRMMNNNTSFSPSAILQVEHGYAGVPATDSAGDFALAMEQSLGFFDDITDKNWKQLQHITATMVDHQKPDNPLQHLPVVDRRAWQKYFAWYQTNYEPNFSCAYEQRVGGNGNGDGPKWICDPHRLTTLSQHRHAQHPDQPGCVVYSIGSECDFQFELGMQRTVGVGICEYHTFDMGDYAHCIPEEFENAHYHRWGIIKQPNRTALTETATPELGKQMYGLHDTIKLLGHEQLKVIDVFKIDCEGCEWTSFEDWLAPGMPQLTQIQVELHKPPRRMATQFFDTLQAAGYVRFHKEPNIQYATGGAIEYAFLKLAKDFFPKEKRVVKEVDPPPVMQLADSTPLVTPVRIPLDRAKELLVPKLENRNTTNREQYIKEYRKNNNMHLSTQQEVDVEDAERSKT